MSGPSDDELDNLARAVSHRWGKGELTDDEAQSLFEEINGRRQPSEAVQPSLVFCPAAGQLVSPGIAELLAHLERRVKLTPLCESPIEVDLGAALVARAGDVFRIVPQFKLSRYRYDFAVMGGSDTPLVLVECDGQAFHSTKEQLANDRAKDEAAIKAGTRVIRVSGKEIYHNPQSWAAFIIGECKAS